MDTILERLTRLAELNAEELAELESDILTEFDSVRAGAKDADDVAVLTQLANGVDSVHARQAEIVAEEEATAADIAALDARIKGQGPEDDDDEDDDAKTDAKASEAEPEPATDPDADETDDDKSDDDDDKTDDADKADDKVLVTASGKANLGNAARKQTKPAVKSRRLANRILRDGGGEFSNLKDVATGIMKRRQSFLSSTVPGVSEKIVVASVQAEYPEDRRLGENMRENDALIAAVVGDEALVAAGGLCAPLEPYYGLTNISTADRPVRAGLTGFGADRGGIVYNEPPTLPDFSGAISQWTEANDTDPGSDGPTTKPCLVVPCGDGREAMLYAVPRCLEFGNMGARAYPEQVEQATALTLAAHSRYAETLLLDQIKAGSKQTTTGQRLGAARDLLYSIGVAGAAYRSRHRMGSSTVLRLAIPQWAYDLVREDLARGLSTTGDSLAVADNVIGEYLRRRNVSPLLYMDSPTDADQVFAGQNDNEGLLDFPDTVEWGLFHEGAWLYLDGGQLDLGLVRDSTLNRTNKYQLFAETFEGTAFVGIESIWVTSNICANGAASGAVDPDDFCSGVYVPQD